MVQTVLGSSADLGLLQCVANCIHGRSQRKAGLADDLILMRMSGTDLSTWLQGTSSGRRRLTRKRGVKHVPQIAAVNNALNFLTAFRASNDPAFHPLIPQDIIKRLEGL